MATLMVREADVVRQISSNDEMFHDGETQYHFCGRSALDCIDVSLQAAQMDPKAVKRILDLPSGHGRVLRYLKVAFPEAQITACDILRNGVDFCASTLGAIPVYSHDDPTKIPLEHDAFDLVWVGSLFTHLDSDVWPRFLSVFRACLRPGGLLVFTTHGRNTYYKMLSGDLDNWLPYYRRSAIRYQYERTGFGYVKFPGSDSYYGVSLSEPAWVLRQIAQMKDMRAVHVSEKSWAAFQDVFACVRDPDWQLQGPPISTVVHLKHRLREVLQQRSW
jgi:SAM-dependent methyltransferase